MRITLNSLKNEENESHFIFIHIERMKESFHPHQRKSILQFLFFGVTAPVSPIVLYKGIIIILLYLTCSNLFIHFTEIFYRKMENERFISFQKLSQERNGTNIREIIVDILYFPITFIISCAVGVKQRHRHRFYFGNWECMRESHIQKK